MKPFRGKFAADSQPKHASTEALIAGFEALAGGRRSTAHWSLIFDDTVLRGQLKGNRRLFRFYLHQALASGGAADVRLKVTDFSEHPADVKEYSFRLRDDGEWVPKLACLRGGVT